MRAALVPLLALAPLAACAAPGAPADPGPSSARACFIPSQVRNFRTEGLGTVYLRTSRDEVFRLTSACGDLDPAWRLALVSDNGVTTCVGDRVTLQASGSVVPASSGRCSAFVDRRLTADEVAALPARARP